MSGTGNAEIDRLVGIAEAGDSAAAATVALMHATLLLRAEQLTTNRLLVALTDQLSGIASYMPGPGAQVDPAIKIRDDQGSLPQVPWPRFDYRERPAMSTADLIGISLFGSWFCARDRAYRMTTSSEKVVMHPFALDHLRAGDDVFERLRLVEGTVVRHAHAHLEAAIRRLQKATEGTPDLGTTEPKAKD